MPRASRIFLSFAALVLGSCLEPLVGDDATYSPNILPPGSTAPELASDPELSGRIAGADGAPSPTLVRRAGYAAGADALYWDLGASERFAITVYQLVRCDEAGMPLEGDAGVVAHAGIVDAVPGDPAYSAYRRVWIACVTPLYAGELLSSLAALRDAITLGLVAEPTPTNTFWNTPILAPDVTFDLGPEAPLFVPLDRYYYRGLAVPTVVLGGPLGGRFTLAGSTLLKAGRVYRLRKSTDPAFFDVVLSTARTMGGVPNPAYVPLFRVINVTMTSAYVAGTSRSEAELFTIAGTTFTKVSADISAFEVTDQYVNLEIQYEEQNP